MRLATAVSTGRDHPWAASAGPTNTRRAATTGVAYCIFVLVLVFVLFPLFVLVLLLGCHFLRNDYRYGLVLVDLRSHSYHRPIDGTDPQLGSALYGLYLKMRGCAWKCFQYSLRSYPKFDGSPIMKFECIFLLGIWWLWWFVNLTIASNNLRMHKIIAISR